MKILITGSSGYLGRNFVSTYKDKYDFLKFSILRQSLNTLLFNNVDTVLHCAALVHQKKSCSHKQYEDANVTYPLTLAKKAKESGARHFIFISTVSVYGDDKELVDEATVCKPSTPYGKSKLAAELELQKLGDENFIVSIIRSPLIYGSGAPGNMGSLITLVKRFWFLPFGGINNKRSFVYIANLIHLIDAVISTKKTGVFLACDDESLGTSRLIELIGEGLGKDMILIKIPFFQSILKALKPSVYASLYGSFLIDNESSKHRLQLKNNIKAEDGVRLMMKETECHVNKKK